MRGLLGDYIMRLSIGDVIREIINFYISRFKNQTLHCYKFCICQTLDTIKN